MRTTDLMTRKPTRPLLLELDLTHGVREAPPATPVEAARFRHIPVLSSIVEALERAADDDAVVGLVAHLGSSGMPLAHSEEIRAAVAHFRHGGKPAVAWSESFGEMAPANIDYHLATGFDEIWLQPTGEVGLVGVVGRAVFVRDALAKLGVRADFHQRYEYKTAANMFVEQQMTGPHREMLESLVTSAMDTVVAGIAEGRGLAPAAVRAAIDAGPLAAEEAKDRGLIDRLGYRDEVYAELRNRLGEVRTRFLSRYAKGPAGVAALRPDLEDLTARVRTLGNRSTPPKPVVAVVRATGSIHLGRSGRSPVGGTSIGSDTLGAALRSVGADDRVRAVVLRVDSPGGSAAASDAIRREVLRLRATNKPVVASMGAVAGSGGYFIAMAADVIVANAGTLTGSIGVLGGKAVVHEALTRAGITRESVTTGQNAEMFSTERPFTDDELQRIDAFLDRTYADFTGKAAADRGIPVEDLRQVAKGRVWSGADAVQRHLVDELGGLQHAVDVACRRAGLDRADVSVRALPKVSPLDRLRPAENSDSPAAAAWDTSTLLRAVGLESWGTLTMPVVYQLR